MYLLKKKKNQKYVYFDRKIGPIFVNSGTSVDPLLLLSYLEVGLKYASDGESLSFSSFLDVWSTV